MLQKIKIFEPARPLKNVQFWSSSRKVKILTAGIHGVFRGLKFESDTDMGEKDSFRSDTIYTKYHCCPVNSGVISDSYLFTCPPTCSFA